MEFIENSEKTGYLDQDYRLFHIKDQIEKNFSLHYHDFHKVIVFLSGQVTYHIEEKSYHLKPWDILLVNRYAVHRPEIQSSVPYERFVLWIQEDSPTTAELCSCFRKAGERSFHLIRLAPQMQELLKNLLYQLESALPSQEFGAAQMSNALFTQFMVYLNRIFLNKAYITDRRSYTYDTRIAELLKYINHHLDQDLSIDTLSAKYYLSKYHLMRTFKEETGCTLHSYITQKRLLLARSFIAQGVPVMKAASQSGYKDYTTFSRAYKKQFHTSPSSREEVRPSPILID